ncbi:calcium/sodium antiporter [Pseudomonadota bacterium]
MLIGLQLLVGFALLLGGAEILVRRAQRLSILLGVSPFLIGLTVVAYGTSAPELAVNINAIMATPPRTGLLIGTIVGSNISNLLLVLGLSALVCPLLIAKQLVRSTLLLMIAVSMLIYVFSSDGYISNLEGIFLFLGSFIYTFHLIWRERHHRHKKIVRPKNQNDNKNRPSFLEITIHLLFILLGLILLVVGADYLVDASIALARILQVAEIVIGLTIIAIGTSLPELATSIIAGFKGHREIVVGNIIGSNIFNILLVLGFCAAISPEDIKVEQSALNFDIPIMVLVSLICFPIFISGYQISRWEGFLLFSYYVVYIWHQYQIQELAAAPAVTDTSFIIWLLPLLLIALLSLIVRIYKAKLQNK